MIILHLPQLSQTTFGDPLLVVSLTPTPPINSLLRRMCFGKLISDHCRFWNCMQVLERSATMMQFLFACT